MRSPSITRHAGAGVSIPAAGAFPPRRRWPNRCRGAPAEWIAYTGPIPAETASPRLAQAPDGRVAASDHAGRQADDGEGTARTVRAPLAPRDLGAVRQRVR